MSKKIIPLLAGSLLLNCVAFYFLVLGEPRIVPSVTQVERVNRATLSEASSGVYRDDNDVLYVRGELTTEIGAQTIQALQEGVSRIVLDISGGEIGQAIRVSEMIAIYRKPIEVISKRHVKDYFELSEDEHRSVFDLLAKHRKQIQKEDPSVSGFNVGMNSGQSAGQTIFHCHVHLIPRRAGDVEDPRGGVRHVIPGKGNY